ncbi:MAG: hypothetical protein HY815_28550 [Candidatus Riflebacteria bacterium]|nr:hypothetical protein [Candidatus Riflebacteria bacterium]
MRTVAAGADDADSRPPLERLLPGFRTVLACETTRDSVGLYDLPAPRGETAVLVGHEERGIPRAVLKKVDRVVSIPMAGEGLSSVNVAVAAAITLYALTRDLARRPASRSRLTHRDVDVLIRAPTDPHELGSLLRSAWAFGWRRVFLDDPHGVWFSRDRAVVLGGRAAARRGKNPLAVLPSEALRNEAHDATVVCCDDRSGAPLSRFRLPVAGRLLLVLGVQPRIDERSGGAPVPGADGVDARPTRTVFVDHVDPGVQARFRHQGSIVLSVLSSLLRG